MTAPRREISSVRMCFGVMLGEISQTLSKDKQNSFTRAIDRRFAATGAGTKKSDLSAWFSRHFVAPTQQARPISLGTGEKP